MCTSEVSAVDNFPRWCNISKQVDWERWSNTLATTVTGYHPLDFFLWGYVKDKVFSTPVQYYKFEGKNKTLLLQQLKTCWRTHGN